jgi:hypothetical protein
VSAAEDQGPTARGPFPAMIFRYGPPPSCREHTTSKLGSFEHPPRDQSRASSPEVAGTPPYLQKVVEAWLFFFDKEKKSGEHHGIMYKYTIFDQKILHNDITNLICHLF